MSVSTRVAGNADLAFLAAVDVHLTPARLAQVVESGRVMIADESGAPVACLRWGLFWDEIPFMNLLWVVESARGQGVGTALVQAWEKERLTEGHQTVLTSTLASERAQHLYRRLGYVDSGSLLLPDEPTELILRRALKP